MLKKIIKDLQTSGDKYSSEVFQGFTFRCNCLNQSSWRRYVAFVVTFFEGSFAIMSLCPYIKFTPVRMCGILLNIYTSLRKFNLNLRA